MGKRESAAAVHSCSCFCGVVCFRWRTAGRDGVSITAACLCLLQLTAEFGVQIGGFEDVLCLVVHLLGRCCVFLLWSVCFNEHRHTHKHNESRNKGRWHNILSPLFPASVHQEPRPRPDERFHRVQLPDRVWLDVRDQPRHERSAGTPDVTLQTLQGGSELIIRDYRCIPTCA